MKNKKPNCYKCKYRGTIPGDAHSKCFNIKAKVVGNPKPTASRATAKSRSAILSNIKPKKALTSPGAAQEYRFSNTCGMKGTDFAARKNCECKTPVQNCQFASLPRPAPFPLRPHRRIEYGERSHEPVRLTPCCPRRFLQISSNSSEPGS